MVKNKSIGSRLFMVFNVLFLTLVAFVCVAPMLHTIFASISDPVLLRSSTGIILWPLGTPNLKGYELIFKNQTIWLGYKNTIFYVVVGTAISTFLTCLGGFALSRPNLYWKNHIMLLISFTMLFSGGLIPTYTVVKMLGLAETRWVMIIPSAISVFNLIIMRTSMQSIPPSLEESAKMDGAGHFTVLTRIIIPVSRATIAVIALFYALNIWNSWFPASIYLTKRKDLLPLQAILREILIMNDTTSVMDTSELSANASGLYKNLVQYATTVVATLPILCIYPFVQKYFVTGVMIGSIKG